ncbi:hypothetical protein V497_03918 [Pseudogymnoascus sp. VKM F-4516 (FW-969)]|nr:hypothetical protein V497_03918 [Pseudogymnoascus sp. VKM F-4516 (FW-969)]
MVGPELFAASLAWSGPLDSAWLTPSLSLLPNVDHKITMYDNLGPKTLYGHLTGTLGSIKNTRAQITALIYFTHMLYLYRDWITAYQRRGGLPPAERVSDDDKRVLKESRPNNSPYGKERLRPASRSHATGDSGVAGNRVFRSGGSEVTPRPWRKVYKYASTILVISPRIVGTRRDRYSAWNVPKAKRRISSPNTSCFSCDDNRGTKLRIMFAKL